MEQQDRNLSLCNLQKRNFLSLNLQGMGLQSCNLQERSLLSCKLQDSNSLSCNFQDRGLLSCHLHDRNFLSCNLQGRGLLSCKLQDRNFLSCNLHDRSFLTGKLRDVSNVRLNFRKFYCWWFGNLACGDLIGTNGIEKDLVHGPPGLVWGKGLVWLSVSEVLIWSGRETEGLVLVFMSFCSTLILSGGWWHGISSFFLILFEGKRWWGEFKIGLVVLAKSKPRGAFHHAAFVFALST